MPRSKREFIPGYFYHIYNRGNRKQPVFFSDSDCKFFFKKLDFLAHKFECDIFIHVRCLMRNHLHVILRQGYSNSISVFMQRLMTSYCIYINKKYGLVGHAFQGRYQVRVIESKAALQRVIHYIRMNPVKAGYIEEPEDYPWFQIDPVPDSR